MKKVGICRICRLFRLFRFGEKIPSSKFTNPKLFANFEVCDFIFLIA